MRRSRTRWHSPCGAERVCLILIAWHHVPDYPLVVAANRDERVDRPAAPAAPWPEHPALLAGRDLDAGGTWLGVTASGRFATVANVRHPGAAPGPRSRGELPKDFLRSASVPADYCRALTIRSDEYGPYTLLAADGDALWAHSNAVTMPGALAPGLYALGNAGLDAPGARVEHARGRFAALLNAGAPSLAALLDLLSDPAEAPAAQAPYSALRLAAGDYGTRCSTALLRSVDGALHFAERTHLPHPAQTVCYTTQGEGSWRASGVPD